MNIFSQSSASMFSQHSLLQNFFSPGSNVQVYFLQLLLYPSSKIKWSIHNSLPNSKGWVNGNVFVNIKCTAKVLKMIVVKTKI